MPLSNLSDTPHLQPAGWLGRQPPIHAWSVDLCTLMHPQMETHHCVDQKTLCGSRETQPGRIKRSSRCAVHDLQAVLHRAAAAGREARQDALYGLRDVTCLAEGAEIHSFVSSDGWWLERLPFQRLTTTACCHMFGRNASELPVSVSVRLLQTSQHLKLQLLKAQVSARVALGPNHAIILVLDAQSVTSFPISSRERRRTRPPPGVALFLGSSSM